MHNSDPFVCNCHDYLLLWNKSWTEIYNKMKTTPECVFFSKHLFRLRNCWQSPVGISTHLPISMLAVCLSGLTFCGSFTWCHSFCKFIYVGAVLFMEDYSLGVTRYFWLLWSFCIFSIDPRVFRKGSDILPIEDGVL